MRRIDLRGLVRSDGEREPVVTGPKLEYDLRGVAGFTEQLQRAGVASGARVLSALVLVAPDDVCAALALQPGARAARIERVRFAAHTALTLEETWLPDALFPEITALGLTESIYALMRDCYDRGPVRATERLEAVPASAPEAKLLHVPVGAPLMLVERTSFAADGTPVEFARDRHRGDRSSFVVETAPHTLTA